MDSKQEPIVDSFDQSTPASGVPILEANLGQIAPAHPETMTGSKTPVNRNCLTNCCV